MKKLLIALLVIGISISVFGQTFTQSGGYVPYNTGSGPADSQIRYDEFPDGSRVVQMFGYLYHFDAASTYFLGAGSSTEINANDWKQGAIVLGDVQHNHNETRLIVDDNDMQITLDGQIILPKLPNCARLATDAQGKIICGQ